MAGIAVHTSNLLALFGQLQVSVVVSTYQAGNDEGVLNTHFRTFGQTHPVKARLSAGQAGESHTDGGLGAGGGSLASVGNGLTHGPRFIVTGA